MKQFLTLLTLILYCFSAQAAPDFYIRGLGNNWDTTDASNKLTQNGSVYFIHLDEITSASSWKIATSDWSSQYGSVEAFAFNKKMVCKAGDGNDFRVPAQGTNTTVVHGATVIFDNSSSEKTVTVVPDLYLTGGFNNWSNTQDACRFTYDYIKDSFSLSVTQLSGEFKIAAGITPDWEIQYGCSTKIALDNPVTCQLNGANMKLADDMQTDIAMTFENSTKRLTIKKISLDIDDNTDLYLSGVINGWSSNNPNYKFTRNGSQYTLELQSLYADFKIVTSDWATQFGGSASIDYDKTYSCFLAQNGGNMKLAEPVGNDVTIHFDLDSRTIRVEGMPTLYIIGDFNNWGISPLYAFTYENGEYKLSTHDFSGKFKISTYDYSYQLGASVDSPFDTDHNYALVETGQTDGNASFGGVTSRADSPRVLLTIVPNGKADSTTTVSSLINDAEYPVEYFNLQGIRVQYPTNGIFIRRQGKTVEKIVIK